MHGTLGMETPVPDGSDHASEIGNTISNALNGRLGKTQILIMSDQDSRRPVHGVRNGVTYF